MDILVNMFPYYKEGGDKKILIERILNILKIIFKHEN